MSQIKTISAQQQAAINHLLEKNLSLGSRCDPLDVRMATTVIAVFYQQLGVPRPKFLILSSPLMCLLAHHWLMLRGQLHDQLHDQLYGQLYGQLHDQLYGQLHDQLRGQLSDQLRGQLYGQLYDQLRDQLHDQLYSQLYDQLRGQLHGQLHDQLYSQLSDQLYSQLHGQLHDQLYGQLHDQLRGQLSDQLRGQLYGQLSDQLYSQLHSQLYGQLSNYFTGQHWIFWTAFYRAGFLAGVRYSEQQLQKLSEWEKEARFCHWWFPYAKVVLLSDRHREVYFDNERRLHHTERAAIMYSDGWGVYAIHGIRVPAKYVLTRSEKINPIEVLKEPNAQIRMAIISKIGFAKMLGKLPHKIIARNPNRRGISRDDELIEFDLGNGQIVRGLHVWWKEKTNEEKETVIPVWHTKEQFGEDCPDNIGDCEQIRRWVMRLPKNAEIVEEI